jgi:hypothetical protein
VRAAARRAVWKAAVVQHPTAFRVDQRVLGGGGDCLGEEVVEAGPGVPGGAADVGERAERVRVLHPAAGAARQQVTHPGRHRGLAGPVHDRLVERFRRRVDSGSGQPAHRVRGVQQPSDVYSVQGGRADGGGA